MYRTRPRLRCVCTDEHHADQTRRVMSIFGSKSETVEHHPEASTSGFVGLEKVFNFLNKYRQIWSS